VKRFYDAVSTFKISLPTPIMSGVRTPTRQFSSCVLIECGDSLDSINATSSAIVKYVSQRAGIGINAGRIRALGSPIRGGEAFHTGCIPFYHFQTVSKILALAWRCCDPVLPDVASGSESLLVLKNNRGVRQPRSSHGLRRTDQQTDVHPSAEREDITLFSPSDVPGLYDAFFADQDEFERLYTKYEKDDSIRKQRVKAVELFSLMMQERLYRPYLHPER
jgi:ribonucleoside-diphosphate reductase alpha chain